MIEDKRQNNKSGGYAILFAVVVVSIISMLAIGMSNSTYKQLVISSIASDSQVAFYQADMASECSMYADNILFTFPHTSTPPAWICGKDIDGNDYTFFTNKIVDNLGNDIGTDYGDRIGYSYSVWPFSAGQSVPCFNFTVYKDVYKSDGRIASLIVNRGYNNCDTTNPKAVERGLVVEF